MSEDEMQVDNRQKKFSLINTLKSATKKERKTFWVDKV